jgi:hypothetical protein
MLLMAQIMPRAALLFLLLCSLSSVVSVEPGSWAAAAVKAGSHDRTPKTRAKGERMMYPPNFESPLPLTPLQKERALMYHLL